MLPGNPALKLLLAKQGLQVERSRCVQHRFKPAGCDRCFKICPSGAIRWTDDGLDWEEAECQSCLLCVAVCPTGALVGKELPFVQTLKKLSAEQKPVLACTGRPSTVGHARLPCLGLLSSAEWLLIFSLALGKPYSLNLVECSACPNAGMLPSLRAAAAEVGAILAHACLIEAEQHLDFRESGVSRREFFSLLRRQTEVAVCSLADQLHEVPERPYGEKSLPPQRLLLMQLLKRKPEVERAELVARLFPQIEISSVSCSGCSGCVGLCPTGALLPAPNPDDPPTAHPPNCTECGLCSAFCSKAAITVTPGWLSQAAKHVLAG